MYREVRLRDAGGADDPVRHRPRPGRGKDSASLADVLTDRVNDLPHHLRGSLT